MTDDILSRDATLRTLRAAVRFKCRCGAHGVRAQEDKGRPCSACGGRLVEWLAGDAEPKEEVTPVG